VVETDLNPSGRDDSSDGIRRERIVSFRETSKPERSSSG
jgi:hypothetical protein